MPYLAPEPIDGDEPLMFDGTSSFVGGMVSNTRANLLEATQSAQLVNFDIDQTGQLVTRRGSTALGSAIAASPIQGMIYYDTPSTEELLAVCNTAFYHGSGGTWTGPVAGYTASSATLNVNFCQLVDKAYFVDGSGKMIRWNGSALADSSAWGVGTEPASGLKVICQHRSRIVAAGTSSNPEYLYFSDLISDNFPSTNIVQVGNGTGDPIIGIFSWIDSLLLVFKERSIYLVDTSDGVGSNASIRKIHDSVGCVAPRSICQVGQDVFFLAHDGVRSVQRTLQSDQQSLTPAISFPINDYFFRINSSAWNTSCATFYGNRYILSVPIDSATTPDTTFVFHTINNSWSGYWTGWTNRVYCITAFSGVIRLHMGNQSGKILYWRDYVTVANETSTDFQDDSVSIASQWRSRSFIFGEFLNPKNGSNFELEFFRSTADVDISSSLDGGNDSLLVGAVPTYTSSGFTVPFTLPLTIPASGIKRHADDLRSLGEFRELQIVLESASGKIALRNIALSANINALHLSS